ncbi:MAG TPA: hypothetical protein VFJ85_13010 [Acidimicrobiales bacterium]|nr:hypothetical protein [Acidimicrobiales bacterium]
MTLLSFLSRRRRAARRTAVGQAGPWPAAVAAAFGGPVVRWSDQPAGGRR